MDIVEDDERVREEKTSLNVSRLFVLQIPTVAGVTIEVATVPGGSTVGPGCRLAVLVLRTDVDCEQRKRSSTMMRCEWPRMAWRERAGMMIRGAPFRLSFLAVVSLSPSLMQAADGPSEQQLAFFGIGDNKKTDRAGRACCAT